MMKIDTACVGVQIARFKVLGFAASKWRTDRIPVVSPTERGELHASRVNFPQAAQIESVLRRGGT